MGTREAATAAGGSTPSSAPPEMSERRPRVGVDEPMYFLATDGAYEGGLPAYHDPERIPAAAVLRRRFEDIRAEVEDLLERRPDAFTTNFTPTDYRNHDFRTLNLCTDGRRYHRNRALLPVTTSVCDSLPGFSSAQVGVLGPGAELVEHRGDTNAVYRMHLALRVPGSLPEVGISVGGHRRSWTEGEVLVIEDAHLHGVWNHTDRPRVILLVDVVKDELLGRAAWTQARAGAGILVQLALLRAPFLERAPRPVLRALHLLLSVPVFLVRPLQRSTALRGPLRRRAC